MDRQELAKVIGRNLKEYRKAKALTQDEVAEQMGISASFYTNIERGTRFPGVHLLYRLAKEFDVDIGSLFLKGEDDGSLDNILSMLYDKPSDFIRSMERLVRVSVEEFSDKL